MRKSKYVLAEWNSSKLWNYVYNPYNPGASLLSPSIINATGGALITAVPIPVTGTSGTLPNGTSVAVPYGSSIVINARSLIQVLRKIVMTGTIPLHHGAAL